MNKRFHAVAAACITLALLMQVPYFLHSTDPRYRGLPVHLNSDEEVYRARVQESLSGRPEQADEAFVGHPGLVGTQFAFIESGLGSIFRFTGLRAPEVLTVLDSVIPVLVFLLLLAFFRLAGFAFLPAFVAACVFCLIELYNLNRPVHMPASFALMMLPLCGLLLMLRFRPEQTMARFVTALCAGSLLGILVGVYFWSWSFAWLFWGLYLVWECGEWVLQLFRAQGRHASRLRRLLLPLGQVFWHFRPRKPSLRFERWHLLLIAGCAGVLAALPYVAELFAASGHPLYPLAVFRSGMRPSHLPESWAYSILFSVMALSVVWTAVRFPEALRPYRSAAVLVLTAFFFMHQQVVHGIVFNFVSHAIFSLAAAALSCVLLAYTLRTKALIIGAAAACVYLAAIAYDGRYVRGQWTVEASRFSQQHLAGALPALDALPRSRILTDPETSSFISGFTKHDVVYSVYLKNVLMTNEELAQRLCLELMAFPAAERRLEEYSVYPDASAAFGPDTRAEELQMMEAECRTVGLSTPEWMRTFEVTMVLWNEAQHPQWDVRRLGVPLTETAHGDGWVLYEVR